MKIAWTAFVLDKGRSGIGTYILNQIEGLATVDRSNAYEVLLPEGSERLFAPLPSNFRFYPLARLVEKPLVNIAWHNSILPLKAFDLVHIPTMRRIPLVKTCPVVATIHDMAPLAMRGKYDPFRTFYHEHLQSRIAHRCDHIITVSHYTKKDIVRFTGYPEEKITVIYSGIDRTTFHPLVKEQALEELRQRYPIQAPFIVYVSRVEHPAKKSLNQIKAFELFKKRQGNAYQLVLPAPTGRVPMW